MLTANISNETTLRTKTHSWSKFLGKAEPPGGRLGRLDYTLQTTLWWWQVERVLKSIPADQRLGGVIVTGAPAPYGKSGAIILNRMMSGGIFAVEMFKAPNGEFVDPQDTLFLDQFGPGFSSQLADLEPVSGFMQNQPTMYVFVKK